MPIPSEVCSLRTQKPASHRRHVKHYEWPWSRPFLAMARMHGPLARNRGTREMDRGPWAMSSFHLSSLLDKCSHVPTSTARFAQDLFPLQPRHAERMCDEICPRDQCLSHGRFCALLSLAPFLLPPPRSAHVRHARNLRNPIVPWAFEWIWTSAPATAAMAFVARCWPSSTLRGSCRIAAHGMGRPHGSPSRAMDHESSMRESDGL